MAKTQIDTTPRRVLVTPKMAEEWLQHNRADVNRKFRPVWCRYLAAQMGGDRWEVTTDAIGFRASDGTLINGQHRLHAVIEHGKPVEMLVVWGLSDNAFSLIDRGMMRSMSDVLHVSPMLAADATLAFMVAKGLTGGRIAEQDVADTVAWWSPAHSRLVSGVMFTKGLAAAHARIGFGARWAIQTTDAHRAYVMDQFKALMGSDAPSMTRATATLWKVMVESGGVKGSKLDRVNMAARCFYYANPQRAEVKPIIKDIQPHLVTLASVLSSMEAAYVAAPKGAAHPYQFTRNVLQTHVAPIRSQRKAERDARAATGG